MKKRPREPARMQRSGRRRRQVRLAGPGAADQHDVALLDDEAAAGEIADERLIDRRFLEGEVVDVLASGSLATVS